MSDTRRKSRNRLGLRFHQTFIPERHYLSSLLRFAAAGGTGSNIEISEKTGIPTGKSSGKVPAILQYAQGMNLVFAEGKLPGRRIRPTPWGEAVLAHDPALGHAFTQWMAHLHLCRRQGGAEIWFRTFGPGSDALGKEFQRETLDRYLTGLFGPAKRSLIGPMKGTYQESAALQKAGALAADGETFLRVPAPLEPAFAHGYAAFLLSLWDRHFPEDRQATLSDFEEETFWGRIHGWDEGQRKQALGMMAEKGALLIDKQMEPWVLTRQASAADFHSLLYSEID
ncbi:MAG: hypothetical protein ACLFQQ_22595 [Desulfococcaceae bacterium]